MRLTAPNEVFLFIFLPNSSWNGMVAVAEMGDEHSKGWEVVWQGHSHEWMNVVITSDNFSVPPLPHLSSQAFHLVWRNPRSSSDSALHAWLSSSVPWKEMNLYCYTFLRLGYLVTIAENGSRLGGTLLLVSRCLNGSFLAAHSSERTFLKHLLCISLIPNIFR